MRKNYLIVYKALNDLGQVIKSGSMRCKNKLSEFDAQAGLDNHFKKTLVGFTKLQVTSCKEDNNIWDLFERMYK